MKNGFFIAGFLSMLLWVGCQNQSKNRNQKVVTVSILPQKYFVEQLTDGQLEVNVMIPPGVGHSTYDPAPQQIRNLGSSMGYLQIGYLGFEQIWLPRIHQNHPNLPIYNLSNGIEPINTEDGEHQIEAEEEESGHHHEGTDPHIWLSPKSARTIAINTAQAIIASDPSCRQQVEGNLSKLVQKIDQLDSMFTQRLLNLKNRSFIIFHPSLTYLARDYNLVQIPIERGGKEATASHLRRLVDTAEAQGIKTIFVQKEYDQENALTLSKELKGKIIQIDPLAEDWYDEMVRILEALTNEE